jgi:hypothetical protein
MGKNKTLTPAQQMKVIQTLKKKSNSRSKEKKVTQSGSFERKINPEKKVEKVATKKSSSPYNTAKAQFKETVSKVNVLNRNVVLLQAKTSTSPKPMTRSKSRSKSPIDLQNQSKKA